MPPPTTNRQLRADHPLLNKSLICQGNRIEPQVDFWQINLETVDFTPQTQPNQPKHPKRLELTESPVILKIAGISVILGVSSC